MDKTRTELLIGKENVDLLSKKHVTIVGCGGVGGYTAVMLARAGVGNMTIIDFDKVSSSNVNRQIIAYQSSIGRDKTDVLKEMILDINPQINIEAINQRLTEENISFLIGNTDIVVDAIDSVKDKIALIIYCKKNNIDILSAMGAGNRCDIPKFEVVDIYKTQGDGLAKVVRKKLRENDITSLEVVTTFSKAQSCGEIIGSISYYPAMCGCTMSAVVINKFIKGEL